MSGKKRADSEEMVGEQTDEALMVAYQAGDAQAFELLYRRYSNHVYNYLRKRIPDTQAAEEVYQSVFLKLHRSRGRYDPKFRFAPWLFTLCRHQVIDAARTKQIYRQPHVPLEDLPLPAPADTEAPELPLGALKADQREILELRYDQDLEFEEIAAHLNLSEVAVRKRVSRALKGLRTLIGKK
ncbi:MAG: sigma-70 family RNA polymerase sigma factor [Bdellovibrionaceae bacterium]|nr:sigma-70 family RNA polymerase sigma factor [Pseudobdellovibrionaceae bacterium]